MTTIKTAGIWDEMDVLARAQFFEGYLNVRPFTLVRGATGKPQLLKAIDKALHEIGGTPNPVWRSSADTGIYKAMFLELHKSLRTSGVQTSLEASDVLQSMMGLAGWEDEEGGRLELGGKSPFWMAGRQVAKTTPEELLSGELLPKGITGIARTLVHRRALDVIRMEKDREIGRKNQSETILEETYGTAPEHDEEDWGGVVDALFGNPNSSVARKFFGWIREEIPHFMPRREGANMILRYLEAIQQGGINTDAEAAAAIGTTSAGLSNAKKVFTESLTGYLENNPDPHEEMLDLFEDAKFLNNLLQGHVRGDKVARLAKKVAARYLRQIRKTARSSKLTISFDYGGAVKEIYPDPYNQTYDSHLIDSRQPQTVQKLALEALKLFVRENPGYATKSFGDVADFLNDYVSQKTGGKWSYVRWNSKSYPD